MRHDFKISTLIMSSCLSVAGCGIDSRSELSEAKDPKNDMGITILRVDNINRATGQKIEFNLPDEYPLLQFSYKSTSTSPAEGEVSTQQFGIRIDCGADYAPAFKAFGYENVRFGSATIVTQNSNQYRNLKVNEHSVISCGKDGLVHPDSRVFVVANEDKSQPDRYYLKFGNDKNPQVTNLYDLRCMNNFNLVPGGIASAVSISKTGLFNLFGHERGVKDSSNDIRIYPLTCSPGSGDGKIYELPAFQQPAKVSPPASARMKSQAYRVKNMDLDDRLQSVDEYLMLMDEKGLGYPVGCGIDDQPLLDAIGIKVDSNSLAFDENSDTISKAQPRQQPLLRCSSDDIDRVVKVANYNLDTYYVRFKGQPNTLVRLGCDKLRNLFLKDSRLTPIEINAMGLKYLTEKPEQASLADLGCVTDLRPSIVKAYTAVFGEVPSEDKVRSEDALLGGGTKDYSYDDIVDFMVRNQAESDSQVNAISARAFRVAKARGILVEEQVFLQKRILKDRKLRAHHDEMVAYIQRIHELGRDELRRAYREAVGSEPDAAALNLWTETFYSNPDYVFSFSFVNDYLVKWNRDNAGLLTTVVNRASLAALGHDISTMERNSYVNSVQQNKVAAHYLRLVEFIQRNPYRLEVFDYGLIESKLFEQNQASDKKYLDICKDPSIISHPEWCRAQIFPNNSKPNQRFKMERLDGDFIRLYERQDGTCLAVPIDSGSGGFIVTQKCNPGWWNQEWLLIRFGYSDYYSLKNRHSGKCLAIPESKRDSGTKLIQWDCIDGLNDQLWKLNAL